MQTPAENRDKSIGYDQEVKCPRPWLLSVISTSVFFFPPIHPKKIYKTSDPDRQKSAKNSLTFHSHSLSSGQVLHLQICLSVISNPDSDQKLLGFVLCLCSIVFCINKLHTQLGARNLTVDLTVTSWLSSHMTNTCLAITCFLVIRQKSRKIKKHWCAKQGCTL